MKTAKCMCPGCNNVGTHRVQVFRRGAEGHGFLCDFHINRNESYYNENAYFQGKQKNNAFTIGVEFETSFSTEKARIEFTASGYLPTHDCTVNCEYKSPIMHGLNSLAKHTVTFERLINDNQLKVNQSCGTHLHVGNIDHLNAQTLDYIKRFYHTLFLPLSNAMDSNPLATSLLFGRPLNDWARPINERTSPINHTNFINMEHSKTIEFRCCKFENAKQYMNCAKFCVACVTAIINNFVLHFNDEPKDKRRYPTITAYRKHKAQTTAKKLVKLFNEYANN